MTAFNISQTGPAPFKNLPVWQVSHPIGGGGDGCLESRRTGCFSHLGLCLPRVARKCRTPIWECAMGLFLTNSTEWISMRVMQFRLPVTATDRRREEDQAIEWNWMWEVFWVGHVISCSNLSWLTARWHVIIGNWWCSLADTVGW